MQAAARHQTALDEIGNLVKAHNRSSGSFGSLGEAPARGANGSEPIGPET